MGKDVVTFLSWAAEPEMEERKLVYILIPRLFLSQTVYLCDYLHVSLFFRSQIIKKNDRILIYAYGKLQMGIKWIFVLSLALLQAGYYRRMRWSVLKSRKLVLDVVN